VIAVALAAQWRSIRLFWATAVRPVGAADTEHADSALLTFSRPPEIVTLERAAIGSTLPSRALFKAAVVREH
jgi:hypothetical protein